MAAETAPRLLVPVQRSVTLRQTVGYAVRQAIEAAETGAPTIHFVYLATWREGDPGTEANRRRADELLEQLSVWARYECEEAEIDPDAIGLETGVIGLDSYLFSPTAYAELLATYAEENRLDRVVVDPEYTLVGHTTLLQPLEFELESLGLTVEEAPVDRPASRGRLVSRTSPARFLTLFGMSFLFYQVLGSAASSTSSPASSPPRSSRSRSQV